MKTNKLEQVSAHTPGPLEISKVKTGFEITNEGGFYVGHARKEADALMFAAASELLEACKSILADLEAGPIMSEQQETLRRVIALAEGKRGA